MGHAGNLKYDRTRTVSSMCYRQDHKKCKRKHASTKNCECECHTITQERTT